MVEEDRRATRRATLRSAPGARAAECELFAEVGAAIARRDAALGAALERVDATAAAALLARPLHIVVSSRSLREHVAAALLRRCGRAVAALSVQTHWALALQVIERAGETPPRGDALFGVAVRRAARSEPELVRVLGALRDGYGLVEAAARDLVDAGFLPVHVDALDEALLAAPASAAVPRARAVVRVTASALESLARDGLAPRAAVLRLARELLASGGDRLLPSAGLWIHGFADATGVVADWLEALLRACGGSAIVGEPVDPFEPGALEREFAEPLLVRLGAVATREATQIAPATPPAIELVRAPGALAEARDAADRIRALLDRGVEPESIAIVVREPEAHRAALGTQLGRLAIPFSTHGFAAGPDARSRRVASLAALLADADQAPIDVWLAASARREDASADLRVGLHVLGLGRLDELTALDLDRALGDRPALVLPVRQGASEGDAAGPTPDGDAPRRRRRVRSRHLARERLEAARDRACAVAADLAAWPALAPCEAHRAALTALLETRLGWQRVRSEGVLDPFFDALDALAAEIPATVLLAREEFALVAGRALEAATRRRVGGAGAGVQVLSAMAARGRCFEHLFLLGMNRDVFPRRPSFDPLLPDGVRHPMRSLLESLPIKARARAEERHLFAELLSASPNVVLSWHFVSDEGRECLRSPYIERLRLARRELPDRTVVPLERDAKAVRRAHEHALRAALVGSRAGLVVIRAAALGEARRELASPIDTDALAATQLAMQGELDPEPNAAGRARLERLSPYGGRTGARTIAADEAPLYVTRLEALARCPWQSFLRNELGLEPVPDALEGLPSLSPLLRGNVVHDVLERIVEAAGAACRVSLADAEARGPRLVVWPEATRLAELAIEASRHAAEREGIRSESFVRALAGSAARALAIARATDWRDSSGLVVLGAELSVELAMADVEGRSRRIAFRADRIDASDDRLRATDYKTGKVPTDAAKAETRRKKFASAVAKGQLLQAVAYLAGLRHRGERSVAGRFLFLRPEAEPATRELEVGRTDGDLVEAFEDVARTAIAARDAGTYPPRLVEAQGDKRPAACGWCEVALACHQGESGVRRRQRIWLERAARDPAALAPDERAAALLLAGQSRHAAEAEGS